MMRFGDSHWRRGVGISEVAERTKALDAARKRSLLGEMASGAHSPSSSSTTKQVCKHCGVDMEETEVSFRSLDEAETHMLRCPTCDRREKRRN